MKHMTQLLPLTDIGLSDDANFRGAQYSRSVSGIPIGLSSYTE